MTNIGVFDGEDDSTKAITETDDELVIPAVLTREGVLPYPRGKMFRSAEELAQALFTFQNAWVVTEKHPEPLVSIVTNRKDIKGNLTNVRLDSDAVDPKARKSPAVRANVHLLKKTLSPKFIEDVKSGARRDVSVGFTYDTEQQPGEWNGEKYDFIQRNILINHVAVGVPVGRVRAPFIGLGVDSLEFEESADSAPAQTPAAPAPPAQPTQTPTAPATPKPANPAQHSKIEVTLTPTNENTGSLIVKVRGLAQL